MPLPPKEPKKPKSRKPYLNYEAASDKHLNFHNAHDSGPVFILCGGYGSGKTHSVAFSILQHLLSNPKFVGQTALVVGLTASHNRNLLLPEFKKILTWTGKTGFQRGYIEGREYTVTTTPDLMISFNHNGSKIIFKSLEAGTNLAGFNVAMVWADEIDKISLEIWNEVQNRCRSVEGGLVFGTCNPGNQSHWLYEHYFKYLDENGFSKPGTYCLYLTMYDNKFLPQQYLEMQERKYGYSGLERERAINGRFVSMEGLVYSMFSRKKHVIERERIQIGENWPSYAGIDFGFRDETAYYRIAITPQNKYVVYFEHYMPGWTPKQHSKIIQQTTGTYIKLPLKTFSDHYSETVQTYRELGINLTLADKSKGSLMNGVGVIQQLLLEERLIICNNCPNLIREFESYAWKKSSNSGQDEPADKFNHALDALRYCVYSLERKIGFVAYDIEEEEPVPVSVSTGAGKKQTFVGYSRNGEALYCSD